MKKWRAAHPIEAAYYNQKSNAKTRGKIFELTLDEYKQFCYQYDYHVGKGRTKTSLSIDCLENEKGYVAGNIAVLPVSENAIKGTKTLHYDYETKTAYVINYGKLIPLHYKTAMPF